LLIQKNADRFNELENFIMAFLLNHFITGFWAFLGFVYPTHKLLPKVYYWIHRPNSLKKWYSTFMAEWFRKALMVAF
jgi:hypothetical protein